MPVARLKRKSNCTGRVISRIVQIPGTEADEFLCDTVINFDWLLFVATLDDASNGEEEKRCFHDDASPLSEYR
jgi:hypothetical protein